MINYQEQLSMDFMAKLAPMAEDFNSVLLANYNEFWLDAMDEAFNKAHKEIYGYLPRGS